MPYDTFYVIETMYEGKLRINNTMSSEGDAIFVARRLSREDGYAMVRRIETVIEFKNGVEHVTKPLLKEFSDETFQRRKRK
jgi:hypothetical protein